MRLYFAGFHESNQEKVFSKEFTKSICVLGSYYYLHRPRARRKFDPTISREFILDCGVFSFTSDHSTEEKKNAITGSINWKEYVRAYANFIKEFNIKNYIELDADAIFGYERTVYYRNMLEDLVGWPSMPVYHLQRTDEQFVADCQGRPYVCYGTNVGEGKDNPNIERIVKLAHEQGCKVHLLGTSNPNFNNDIKVDSLDATTWAKSIVFGNRLNWEPSMGRNYKIRKVTRDEQLKPSWREKSMSCALWARFARWMDTHVECVWEEDRLNPQHIDEDDMSTEEVVERYRTLPHWQLSENSG